MPYMDILYYFLPGILILGIATSYTDIKYGKIKNKWILFGLFYGLIINLVLILYYLHQKNLSFGYVSELFVNICFGLLVGFGFWLLKIWTAGDGKLFFAYSILIPLAVYRHGYIRWIPSAMLLVNVFVPLFLYFSFISLFKSSRKSKKTTVKDIFGKKLISSFFYLFIIHWFISAFSMLIKLNGFLTKAVLMMFIFYIFGKRFKRKEHIKKHKRKLIILIIALCIVRLLLDKSVYTMNFWQEFLYFFLFLSIFRSVINLGVNSFSKEVSIKNLKPGMLLAERIVKKGKKYVKKKNQSLFNLEKGFIEEEAEGLTEEDIKKIKKTNIKKIKIKQTIPFAPFIFLGVLLTLIAKGNILILVRFLF